MYLLAQLPAEQLTTQIKNGLILLVWYGYRFCVSNNSCILNKVGLQDC